jgi:hypothetical protein
VVKPEELLCAPNLSASPARLTGTAMSHLTAAWSRSRRGRRRTDSSLAVRSRQLQGTQRSFARGTRLRARRTSGTRWSLRTMFGSAALTSSGGPRRVDAARCRRSRRNFRRNLCGPHVALLATPRSSIRAAVPRISAARSSRAPTTQVRRQVWGVLRILRFLRRPHPCRSEETTATTRRRTQ